MLHYHIIKRSSRNVQNSVWPPIIENGDKSKVNDLIKAYELRMQYFPTKTKEGKVLADIAQVKFDNGIGTMMDQFKDFTEKQD